MHHRLHAPLSDHVRAPAPPPRIAPAAAAAVHIGHVVNTGESADGVEDVVSVDAGTKNPPIADTVRTAPIAPAVHEAHAPVTRIYVVEVTHEHHEHLAVCPAILAYPDPTAGGPEAIRLSVNRGDILSVGQLLN